MKIALVHNDIPADAPLDTLETINDIKEISTHLAQIGKEVKHFIWADRIEPLEKALHDWKPDFIFNMVETTHGSDELLYLATAFFDYMRIPYSGCSTVALTLLSDKMKHKEILKMAGLPTADFFHLNALPQTPEDGSRWFVKSNTQHASAGIDAGNVVNSQKEAIEKIKEKQAKYGSVWFAEKYIEGREFHVTLLDKGDNTPEAFKPAELVFIDYPDDVPKIIDYAAKWEEDSFEFKGTVRSFNYSPDDGELLKKMQNIALECWPLFSLTGCARLDFRVDKDGNPWILEVNANPCLSSQAGCMAAAKECGVTPFEVIKRHIIK